MSDGQAGGSIYWVPAGLQTTVPNTVGNFRETSTLIKMDIQYWKYIEKYLYLETFVYQCNAMVPVKDVVVVTESTRDCFTRSY